MRISVRFASHWPAVLLALIALMCSASLAAGQNQGSAPVQAGELQPIQLPKPEITGGAPLMQALAKRQTTRAFLDKPLPPQTLSNLLWAAFGVNRPREVKSGLGRTAPSAMNKQDVELDVVLASGVYVYEAEANRLRPVLAGDLRAQLSPSPAAHAAVTIIYVADAKDSYAQVDTGFIGQNVYLFAASEGLNAWFYAIHGQDVAGVLKLPEGRQPLYEQSIGYPPQ
jgi:nitroreductase